MYLYFGFGFVIFESRFSVSWDFVVAAPPAGGGWQAQGSRRVKSRARNKAASKHSAQAVQASTVQAQLYRRYTKESWIKVYRKLIWEYRIYRKQIYRIYRKRAVVGSKLYRRVQL